MGDDNLEHARDNAKGWLQSIEEMLPVLKAANDADGSGAYEEAQEAIRESVLCVLIRDSWREPGKPAEDGAEEYEILLSTGGPALMGQTWPIFRA
jgi:hypothetical protein